MFVLWNEFTDTYVAPSDANCITCTGGHGKCVFDRPRQHGIENARAFPTKKAAMAYPEPGLMRVVEITWGILWKIDGKRDERNPYLFKVGKGPRRFTWTESQKRSKRFTREGAKEVRALWRGRSPGNGPVLVRFKKIVA